MLIFDGRNRVTSAYRTAKRPNHHGIDIVGDDSKVIRSPVEGTVKSSTIVTNKKNKTWEWGNYVRVDDSQGNRYYFCHMASRSVKVGDKVKVGTELGIMGNTGYSFGAHTHFEIRKPDNSTRINPAEFLDIPNSEGVYTESISTTQSKSSSGGSVKVEAAKSFSKSFSKEYTVTATALNVRCGAGTTKSIIKTLKKNDRVNCYGYYTMNGITTWLYVKCNDGTIGYVSKKYLR